MLYYQQPLGTCVKKGTQSHVIHRGYKALSSKGTHFDLFQTSHKGRALLGHLVYLSSCFRDEKPEAKKESHSKLSSWGGGGVVEEPGSCLLSLSQLKELPTLVVLCSALLASVQQVRGQTAWERRLRLGHRQHPPKRSYQPVPQDMLLKFPVHVLGNRLMAATPWYLVPCVPKANQIDRERIQQPFKNCLFLSQVQAWGNITLGFCIPWDIPP